MTIDFVEKVLGLLLVILLTAITVLILFGLFLTMREMIKVF